MTLLAYRPLERVYKFHETSETWILRRYAQSVEVDEYGEPKRPAYSETVIPFFRDSRTQKGRRDDSGQVSDEICTVYPRVRLRVTNAATPGTPTFMDVLFDVGGFTGELGSAWVVTEVHGWHPAGGFEHVLIRQGQRGSAPWV